jgi:hypothetical protein
VFTLLEVVCGARVIAATVFTLEDIVPADTVVPKVYVVPLVTARPSASPVVEVNVLEKLIVVAVMVALKGPVDPEQDVAARLP